MITFKIINPPAPNQWGTAASWNLVYGAPDGNAPNTVALTAPIVVNMAAKTWDYIAFIAYASPVGTPAIEATGVVQNRTLTSLAVEDGKTYTMDMATGQLVGAGGGGGTTSKTWMWIGAGLLVVGIAAYFLMRRRHSAVRRLVRARAS